MGSVDDRNTGRARRLANVQVAPGADNPTCPLHHRLANLWRGRWLHDGSSDGGDVFVRLDCALRPL